MPAEAPGLTSHREANRRHYKRHRAEIAAAKKTARQTEHVRAQRRAANKRYRQGHPDRVGATLAAWHLAHPGYERDRGRVRYATQPAYRAKLRRFARSSKGRAAEDRRRARLRSVESTLTAGEWAAIVAWYDGRCAYCFAVVTILEHDHVVPISRGGAHVAANVVPACKSCNCSKGARTPQEWLHAR